MARIYMNCPTWLQLNKVQSSYTARHVIAVILLLVLLATVIFMSIEVLFFNSVDTAQLEKVSPHRQLHEINSPASNFGPNVHYGIVIDCGSSGSRVYVYFWPPHSGNPKDLLDIQQLMTTDGKPVVKKVTPGLDTFEENPGAASDYLKPLLKYAASHIPQEHHKETLLFILATAGMRLIPVQAQTKILEDLKADIPKDFNFVIADSHFEVITGKMEGVYAWIAANYVLQKFGHGADDHSLVVVELPGKRTHVRRRTVGMLDMGGGSLQIAFEVTSKVDEIPKHRLAEFNLGCQHTDLDHSYRVYVTTFLGFGANEARERYEQQLIENAADLDVSAKNISLSNRNDTNVQMSHFGHHHGKRVIPDPCLPVGLIHESKDEDEHSHFFKGTGDYKVCQASLVPLLNLSSSCEQRPCSMNGVFQPEISFHNSDFYGFSEFWYTMEDVFRMGGLYDSLKFENEAKEFCSKKWTTLFNWHEQKLFPHADESRFRLQCFKASWLTTVLHRGLRFPRDYHQLHSVQLINSRDVQWTLGALIHRTRHLPLRDIKTLEMQHYKPPWKHKWIFYNQYIIVICFIIVLTAILLYMKRLRLCPKNRTDLSRVPSMSYFMTEENQVEQGVRFIKGYDYP